jgi:hypothetical protein
MSITASHPPMGVGPINQVSEPTQSSRNGTIALSISMQCQNGAAHININKA